MRVLYPLSIASIWRLFLLDMQYWTRKLSLLMFPYLNQLVWLVTVALAIVTVFVAAQIVFSDEKVYPTLYNYFALLTMNRGFLRLNCFLFHNRVFYNDSCICFQRHRKELIRHKIMSWLVDSTVLETIRPSQLYSTKRSIQLGCQCRTPTFFQPIEICRSLGWTWKNGRYNYHEDAEK